MPFPSECPACKSSIEVPAPAPAEVVCPACGKVLSDPERTAPCSPPDRPLRLGRYEILEEVGSGSFGTVYRARDTELDRIVALKAPRAGSLPGRHDMERFLREARAAAQLRHPGIVLLYDAGWIGDTFVIASEFIEGATLSDHLTAKRFTPREAAELVALVADAVDHAHRRGVIHRDLKPSNIMLDGEVRPHVMDFGLAKRLRGDPTVTLEGQVLGTPAYMSPEQARGDPERVEARSDVYSLGVILYELLTGELPFRGNARMVILQAAREEPRPPRRVNDRIPRDLETVCLKAMSREPGRRYPTAAAMAEDLRRFLDGRPVLARPAGRLLRVSRWCRRNPAVATLLSLVMLLLAGTAAGATLVAVMLAGAARKERELRNTASTALNREAIERIRAEGMAEAHRLSDYVARVNLAQRAFLANDVVRARALLESLVPAAGQKDLRGFEWYHLWRSCRGELLALRGHPRAVQAVAYTGRGDGILTASRYSVRLWDSATGELRRVFARKNLDFWSLAVSPDGRRFAAGSGRPGHASGQLRVWSLESTDGGDLLFEREDLTAPVLAVAWSPDGGLVATGTAGVRPPGDNPRTRVFWIDQPARTGEIELWDAETGERRKALEGATGGILSVAFARGGSGLLAGTWDGRAVLFDVETGGLERDLGGHSGSVWSVAVAADGITAATAAGKWDGAAEVRLWDLATGEHRRSLRGHESGVKCVEFSPDGTRIVTAGWDRTARIWDADSGTEIDVLRGHSGYLSAATFSPTGESIATASWDGTARIWTAMERLDRISFRGWETGGGYSVAFSGDGRLLATAGEDLRAIDLALGKVVATVPGHSGMTLAAFAPDGAIVTAGMDGRLLVRDPPAWETRFERDAGTGGIWSLALAADGRTIATGDASGTIRCWEARDGSEVASIRAGSGHLRSLAFDPTGSLLAASIHEAGAQRSTVGLWHAGTWTPIATRFEGHTDRVECVAFSPDGRILATGSHDATARLWDVATGRPLGVLEGHAEVVYHLAFSPDGRTLATASWDGTVKLWSVAAGELLGSLPAGAGVAYHVAFSPDGSALAVGSGFAEAHDVSAMPVREVRLYLASTKEDVARDIRSGRAATPAPLWSIADGVISSAVALPRDAAWAAAAGESLRILPLDKEVERGTVRELPLGRVVANNLVVSPDERTLAVGCTDGGIRIVDAGMLEVRSVLRPPGLGEAEFAHVKALAFSPRGDRLAAGWWGTNAIQIWRTSDWAGETAFEGHAGTVAGLAFTARADLIASGSWDHTVRLWDLASGREVGAVRGHRWGLSSVAVGAGGEWLAAGGGFGDPRILEWRRGSDGRWEGPAVLGSHGDEVTALEALDDGSILTASWDGRIGWWGPPGDRKARSFPAHDAPITSLAVAAEAGIVVTASDDRTLKAWSLEQLRELPDATPEPSRGPIVRHDPSRGLDLASLVREERWEELESGATRVAELYGASREIFSFLAISRRARGDRAGAEEAIGGHLRFCRGCAWALAFLATTREESRRWGPAREALEALVESKPRDPWALNRLAWFLVTAPPEHRDPALALTLARKAVALEPGSHAIANTLGAALYRNGDPAGAIATLEEARRKHPGGGLPHDFLLLAMAHRLLGDRDAARRCLERARAKLEAETAADGSLPRDLEELRAEAEALLAAEASPTPGEPTPGR